VDTPVTVQVTRIYWTYRNRHESRPRHARRAAYPDHV